MSLWIVDATSDEIADMEYRHDKQFWPLKIVDGEVLMGLRQGSLAERAEGEDDERQEALRHMQWKPSDPGRYVRAVRRRARRRFGDDDRG